MDEFFEVNRGTSYVPYTVKSIWILEILWSWFGVAIFFDFQERE